MSRIIRTSKKDAEVEREYEEDVERVVRQFAPPLQPKVRKAFRLADEGDYENAAALCCRILDEDAEKPEIRYLLAICYFSQGHMESAIMVLRDLKIEYPDEEDYRCLLGMAYHGTGDCREAVKEFHSVYPPKRDHPLYFTSYGDSLQTVGKTKESRAVFYQEIERYIKTGEILSEEMLDGAFRHLLYLDVILGNRKYQEDLEVYLRFLDEVEMTEAMQENLGSTVVLLSTLMHNKWYRPLFMELITYIQNKGFFTTEQGKKILESAYLSWESYVYHDDKKVSKITESFLNNVYNVKYAVSDEDFEETKEYTQAEMLICEWHMCQYAPEHREELEYVRETYPHNYVCCREEIDRITADPEGTAEEVLVQLQHIKDFLTVEEHRRALQSEYMMITGAKGFGEYVSLGDEPYRRSQVKVGRNDPCPCGSGKKYKKCCGR